MATDPIDFSAISALSTPDPCEDAQTLVSKAERCRRLAAGISDKQTADVLLHMALTYEQAAGRLQPLRGK